ncbi:MAG: hypothetical protein HPAVJP_4260 [Candidatus Hepatoplasma vulgare]|nr:MAG: hypothetical protein HPAVJP_4260 [Candidatus Hepatoplasma sp.]
MNYETKESSKKTVSKTEERLKTFSDKNRKFFHSNWSFIIFISFFTILAIVQLSYDGTKGYLTNNANDQLTVDLLIWINAICMICSMIFTARINTWFFAFSLLGLITLIVRSIIVGLLLNALKSVIVFLPVILRFIRWFKGQHAGRDINVRRMPIFLFIGIVIAVSAISYGVGVGATNLDEETLPYTDSVNFCFTLASSMLIAFGFIEGWLFALVIGITAILSYVLLNADGVISLSIVGLGAASVFLLLSVGTILTWMSIYYSRNNTFKYTKKQKIQHEN